MLYGHASELAIRAALFLSRQPAGTLSTVQEVARNTGLPQPYLAKILRQLVTARLVRAFRGPGGGLELGRPPGAITLGAIVRAVEGPIRTDRCVLGVQGCSEQQPCPLHEQWRPLCREMQRLLEQTTLEKLATRLRCRESSRAGGQAAKNGRRSRGSRGTRARSKE